jgi:hypothetical protein
VGGNKERSKKGREERYKGRRKGREEREFHGTQFVSLCYSTHRRDHMKASKKCETLR